MAATTSVSDEEVPPWAAGTAQRMHELDPALSDDEIEILKRYGGEQRYAAGEVLWEAGTRGPFMLVLEGGIDVYHDRDNADHVIISHGPRHYIGETVTMSGGRALVSGRARDSLRAVVVESSDLRRLIATETELGEKLLLSFILRRMRMVAEHLADIKLIGNPGDVATGRLVGFLARNGIPHEATGADVESERLRGLLEEFSLDESSLPAVVCNGVVLARPSNRQLAEQLGFTEEIDCGVTYDVAVVGSGPAGLTAAVYAASEGLSVLVLESCAPGGQAATSSKIENYMGFPTGISGQALMGRAYIQAQKFGANIAVARELERLECGAPHHKLRIDGGDIVYARAVVLASGAIYRKPPIDGLDEFGGVHYGASYIEGEMCRGRNVTVVGGGNSAGQAAIYLSRRARTVNIVIRGESLKRSMSSYLVNRIEQTDNIVLHTNTEVERADGDEGLECLVVRNNRSGETSEVESSHLFIFIGAEPGTSFLGEQIALDNRGFVLTGDDISDEMLISSGWQEERRPYLLETSCPRVFAAGDVRSGSVKRVSSAVGEGSVCIQYIHRILGDRNQDSKK